MNHNNKKNSSDGDATGEVMSWVIIFILMFAFWPVGLPLLILKMHRKAKPSRNTSRQVAAQNADQPRQQVAQPPTKKRKDRNALDKKTGKFVSVILLLISVALFIIGAHTIAGAAFGSSGEEFDRWGEVALGGFYFIGGFISFFSRNIGVRRLARYKKYYAFAAGRGVIPISDIARAAGLSKRTVTRDLQAMIIAGYFESGAYLDSELDSLILSAEAAEEIRQSARAAQEAEPISAINNENQYMAIITELLEINIAIADISISRKVDRIEELTAKIFRIVEENPEKQSQIRRFMSYYLPTTIKLLRSYATLEKQGVKGENIMAAKENIGRILDTLSTGFEQQLDQLFRSDAMDIAADINVLENLMLQDGLAGDRPEFKTMQGST